jgi:hypothetical protein
MSFPRGESKYRAAPPTDDDDAFGEVYAAGREHVDDVA